MNQDSSASGVTKSLTGSTITRCDIILTWKSLHLILCQGHARHCANNTTGGLVEVLFRMEQEDEARVGQENQGAEVANPLGVKEEEAPLKTEEEQTDTSNKSDPIIIISDEDTDADPM